MDTFTTKSPARWAASVLLLLFASLFGGAATFWLVNLGVAIDGINFTWQTPTQTSEISNASTENEQNEIASAERDTTNSAKAADEPQEFVLLFRGLSKDHSTVTPFLLMWFFLGISLGLVKIIRSQIPKEHWYGWRQFPFSEDFKVTWVQLGLLGTIWAFLLIGFQLEDQKDTLEAITILVSAFGTALLSTFTAVVLSFICAPLVIRGFHLFLEHAVVEVDMLPWKKSMSDAIDKAQNSMHTFSEEVKKFTGTVKTTQEALTKITEALELVREKLNAVPDVKSEVGAIKKSVSEIEGRLKGFPEGVTQAINGAATSVVEASKEAQKILKDEIGAQHKTTNAGIAQNLQQIQAQKAEHARTRTHVSSQLKPLNRIEGDVKEHIKPQLSEGLDKHAETKKLIEEEMRALQDSQRGHFGDLKQEIARLRNSRVSTTQASDTNGSAEGRRRGFFRDWLPSFRRNNR